MKILKKARNNIISVVISLSVFAFVLILFNLESRDIFRPLRYFKNAELKALDALFYLRGKRDTGTEIAIVLIDENSIKKLDRYPLPRQHIAKVVDIISDAGAKVLAHDLIYAEPQNVFHIKSLERLKQGYLALNKGEGVDEDDYIKLLEHEKIIADADLELQKSFERAVMEKGVNIVIAYRFINEYEVKTTGYTGKELSQEEQMLLKDSAYFPVYVEVPDFVKEQVGEERANTPEIRGQAREMIVERYPPKNGVGVLNAIYPLAMWSSYQGFTDHNANYNGGISHEFMAIQYKGDFYPSIGVQIARIFLDVQPGGLQFWLANRLKIKDFEFSLDDMNRTIINYCGPSYTFPSYSFIDVYEGKVGPEAFKDKVVFLGDSTSTGGDFILSPFSSKMPGVEKQATIVENLIHGKFLKKDQNEVFMGLIVLDRHLFKFIVCLCLLLGIVLPFVPIVIGGLISTVLLSGYYYYCYYNFVNNGLWINITYPTIAVILCFSSVSLFRNIITEKSKRVIKGVFENFMDPKVVNELLKEPAGIRLGGEEKEITIFFSDIEKFSTISENMLPTELVELLNEYLSEMTDIILEHGGYLDKYIGDAIVAAFGAPLPQSDHAVRACLAAIDNQKKLLELNERLKERGKPEIKARIGINSGNALVGNVGSANRLSYTVIGDEVNLGARLESANKQFGTYTMISERTYELARDHIEARELDIVRVVGRETPVRVYELLGKKGEIGKSKKEVSDLYKSGLSEYRKREWEKAVSLFREALHKDPNDGPSSIYLYRCMNFAQNGPPKDWDGVHTLESK